MITIAIDGSTKNSGIAIFKENVLDMNVSVKVLKMY